MTLYGASARHFSQLLARCPLCTIAYLCNDSFFGESCRCPVAKRLHFSRKLLFLPSHLPTPTMSRFPRSTFLTPGRVNQWPNRIDPPGSVQDFKGNSFLRSNTVPSSDKLDVIEDFIQKHKVHFDLFTFHATPSTFHLLKLFYEIFTTVGFHFCLEKETTETIMKINILNECLFSPLRPFNTQIFYNFANCGGIPPSLYALHWHIVNRFEPIFQEGQLSAGTILKTEETSFAQMDFEIFKSSLNVQSCKDITVLLAQTESLVYQRIHKSLQDKYYSVKETINKQQRKLSELDLQETNIKKQLCDLPITNLSTIQYSFGQLEEKHSELSETFKMFQEKTFKFMMAKSRRHFQKKCYKLQQKLTASQMAQERNAIMECLQIVEHLKHRDTVSLQIPDTLPAIQHQLKKYTKRLFEDRPKMGLFPQNKEDIDNWNIASNKVNLAKASKGKESKRTKKASDSKRANKNNAP